MRHEKAARRRRLSFARQACRRPPDPDRQLVCASSVTMWRLTWAPTADLRPALRSAPPWVVFCFIPSATRPNAK